MAEGTIGVGIIGAGGVASAHAKAYLQKELASQLRLIAVADVVEERARAFAEKYHILNWFTDPQQLLKREDIHIVSLCTPHHLHAPHAIEALQAGKHVLVEKPMAISLEEADQMIAESEARNRRLGVIYQLRFEHDACRAMQLLRQGLLGQIFFCESACLWWRRSTYYDVDWRGKWATEGGGAVINQASHHLDLLQWLMGMPTEVNAYLATVAHEIEVEDWGWATLSWSERCQGIFCATTAAELESDLSRFLILGTQGSLQLFPFRPHSRSDGHLARMVDACRSVSDTGLGGHTAQILDFVQAVLENRSPSVDGQEGRKSLELATAIYQSAFLGKPVRLPLDRSAPCYTTEGKLEAAYAFLKRR